MNMAGLKRFLSGLLAALMIVTLLPTPAWATTSGECGDNATWSYADNTLTISGTGEVTSAPWAAESGLTIQKVVVESGITSLCNDAFHTQTSLTSVSLPDTLLTIGDYAFYRTSLTKIAIPESVTSIGSFAFARCKSLISMRIARNRTSSGAAKTDIDYHAFYGCTSLTSVTLDGVKSIGDWAFGYCTSLSSVTIPVGLNSIGSCAFIDCTNMQ